MEIPNPKIFSVSGSEKLEGVTLGQRAILIHLTSEIVSSYF